MDLKPTWPAVGVYPGIDQATYFAKQEVPFREMMVSKSLLWDFAKNPKRWLESPPKDVTDAMRWGHLVDCLLLTPKRFASAYVMQPETYVSKPEGEIVLTTDFPGEWNGRTKECRTWKAEKETGGATVMTPEELEKQSQPKPWNWNSDTCKAWRDALPAGVEILDPFRKFEAEIAVRKLRERREVAEILQGAQTQVGMRYDFTDIIHGIPGFTVPCKSLIDIVPDRRGDWGNALADLKEFAKLNSLEDVEKEIFNRGYHVQAALYLDIWNALTGEDRDRWMMIFQLSAKPYEVAVIEMDPDAIFAGREWYLNAVRKWAEVVTSGRWPSPWDGIQSAKLPRWASRKEAA